MMGKNFWMNRFNTETLRLWRQVIFRKIYQWDCLTFMILSWLWMIRCVLCLVASEGKCLHYIYIYIYSERKHFACGRFVRVELP